MPLLNALDFAADRLLVSYRASTEPQDVTIHFTFKAPSNGAPITFYSIYSEIRYGMAGSDIFAPTVCDAVVPPARLMQEGRISPSEYRVVLKGMRCVAPIFVRQIVEQMRGVGQHVELSSLVIRGELPTDATSMSVTEESVRRWIEDVNAYPKRWPTPSFALQEKELGGKGVSARISFAHPPNPAQQQELQMRILTWRNLADYYVSPTGTFVRHSLGPTLPKVVFKKAEAVASIELFLHTRAPAMDLLVNLLERVHHDVLPITSVSLTT